MEAFLLQETLPDESNKEPPTKKTRRRSDTQNPEQCRAPTSPDILVMDSGGGHTCTGTSRAFRVLERSNRTVTFRAYGQAGTGSSLPIVTGATKALIPGMETPVLFVIHNMTLLDDEQEHESLAVPFELMRNSIQVDDTPIEFGGKCGITIDSNFLPMQWDGEKLYFNIGYPSESDMAQLPLYELTPRLPGKHLVRRRSTRTDPLLSGIPIEEWRKRLAMLPEPVIRKTLENTTQYCLHPEMENRSDPRRQFQSVLKAIRHRRRNEVVATDTYFPSVTSARGNTCAQFFVGQKSLKWSTYPLKKESQNFTAFQDICREQGLPDAIRSDRAQSEIGTQWTKFARQHVIQQQSTVPHSQWMNFAERNIGQLGSMVRICHHEFKIPFKYNDWVAKWCCDVHNVAASRALNWQSPNTIADGYTCDISAFRFHVWEPIWYYDHTTKPPLSRWKPGRWLGFADNIGDAMSYWILPESANKKKRPKPLVRNIVRSRRRDIGTDSESVSTTPPADETNGTSLSLSMNPQSENVDSGETMETEEADDSMATGMDPTDDNPGELEPGETEPLNRDPSPDANTDAEDEAEDDIDSDSETLQALYDQMEKDNTDERELEGLEFDKIVDHQWSNGILEFTVRYLDEHGERHFIETCFPTLRQDEPVECARYIKNYVTDSTRKGYHVTWAAKTLKNHTRAVRRLYRIYNVDATMRVRRNRQTRVNSLRSKLPKNTNRPSEKFGFKIPRNTREALILDREAGNTLWADAISKEMKSLDTLDVFEYHSPTKTLDKNEGWQYAPLRMIFDIKQQDLRRKARLVVGGHVLDSSRYTKASSTVQGLSVRLLLLIAVQNGLSSMTGDIGNAFCTAPVAEKVWTRAGPEFGARQGSIVSLKRALYGLPTASRSYNLWFGDLLLRMGFQPSRADSELWYRKSDEYEGYDYIATHVDDIICVAKDPSKYMTMVEHEFKVRDMTCSPDYYLGNDIKTSRNGSGFHVSSAKYINEVIRKYESEHGQIRKEQVPMQPKTHPELDQSELLGISDIKRFQKIIGICQWLIVAGRLDICYAVSSLSRFCIGPRRGHLDAAVRVLGYLKKYPKRGYVVDPRPPQIDLEYQNIEVKCDFGHQYSYFSEIMDPRFPAPLMKELDMNIFVDADHGHDKRTGLSITGFLTMIGRTPTSYGSHRQKCVQTSTFGAEFTALKRAVEEAVAVRYHLRSMGVAVTKPTSIWVDNMGVVLNATEPASALNKKHVALAYHFVREHQSGTNPVITIKKIDSEDNYADPFTKALPNDQFHGHMHQLLVNY